MRWREAWTQGGTNSGLAINLRVADEVCDGSVLTAGSVDKGMRVGHQELARRSPVGSLCSDGCVDVKSRHRSGRRRGGARDGSGRQWCRSPRCFRSCVKVDLRGANKLDIESSRAGSRLPSFPLVDVCARNRGIEKDVRGVVLATLGAVDKGKTSWMMGA